MARPAIRRRLTFAIQCACHPANAIERCLFRTLLAARLTSCLFERLFLAMSLQLRNAARVLAPCIRCTARESRAIFEICILHEINAAFIWSCKDPMSAFTALTFALCSIIRYCTFLSSASCLYINPFHFENAANCALCRIRTQHR